MKLFISLVLAIVLATCGRPADNVGGVCEIDCSSPIIAGPESEIHLLGGEQTIDINCTGIDPGDRFDSQVPLRFVVGRKSPNFDEIIPPRPPNEGGESPELIPQPGVGFQAVVMSGSAPSPGHSEGNRLYRGILTEPDFWCTDACGVGSIDIQPICREGAYTLSVLIHSGSAAKVVNVLVRQN